MSHLAEPGMNDEAEEGRREARAPRTAAMHEEDGHENGERVDPMARADEITRLPSRTNLHSQSSKTLNGRKWSSRLGLKRKDSLEYDARHVNGVEITHAAYGSRKLPLALQLTLAYQTVGVVYGDLGTSPLYVYSSIFNDRIPVHDEILGALSIIIYTFTLLPLVKYVFIVLRANDHGNGGTFSLYSKICRFAKLPVVQNQAPEDQEVSTYNLNLDSSTYRRSSWMKDRLQQSSVLKTVLLSIAVLGTCMVIGDGVLTPSISVLSAIQGIKTEAGSVTQTTVVLISCIILILLFSVQRFGTDKVGYIFSPVVIVWFLSILMIGVYNIVKHDPTIFKAFNPYYIYVFFKLGKKRAWASLGGAVLCITGTEAMFADLTHFSVRSIQIAFTLFVYPCLLVAYIGQAAYLTKNPEHVSQTFFKSIPSSVYWPMFAVATGAAIIASQAMISATFSIIYQAVNLGCFPRVRILHTSKKHAGQIYIPEMNWLLMVLCVAIAAGFRDTSQIGNAYGVCVNADMLITTHLLTLVIIMIWQKHLWVAFAFYATFASVELTYFSAVLHKIPQGGWVPLVFVGIFSFIMFTWYYGRSKKYQYEVKHKVSLDWVVGLGSSLGMARVPGVGLVYTELAQGVPTIFSHLIHNLPAMHSILVFVCIKYLPLPNISDEERFLVRRVGPKQFRMYRCAVRYGYMDQQDDEELFQNLLIQSLARFMQTEAGEVSMEGIGTPEKFVHIDMNASSNSLVPMNIIEAAKDLPKKASQNSLDGIQGLANEQSGGYSLSEELTHLDTAKNAGIVYMLGQAQIKAAKDSSAFKKFIIDQAFSLLQRNSPTSTVYLNVPHSRLLLVGMIHKI